MFKKTQRYNNYFHHAGRRYTLQSYFEEIREFPHPRSSEGLRVYAQKRGMEVGIQAAEAFVTLKDVWR